MLELGNTIYPHAGQKIIYEGSPVGDAHSAMIMLHGRGAGAGSMKGLVGEIYTDRMLFIIPEAAGFTWYPYRFIEKREVNEPGITSGLMLIESIVNALIKNDILKENIFLLGFSQGACLAADYAARYPARFGGVFVLSGGLIGDVINPPEYQGNLVQTPVFLGCSDTDFHIPQERFHESADILSHLNAAVTKKIYTGMGHTINRDELVLINAVIADNRFAD